MAQDFEPLLFIAPIAPKEKLVVRSLTDSKDGPIYNGLLVATPWRLFAFNSDGEGDTGNVRYFRYESFQDAGLSSGTLNWVRLNSGRVITADVNAERLSAFREALIRGVAGDVVAAGMAADRHVHDWNQIADALNGALYRFFSAATQDRWPYWGPAFASA